MSVPETSHLISHEARLQASQLLRSVLPPILGVRIPTRGRGLHWPPPPPPPSLPLLQPDVPCLLRCWQRLTYLSAHTPPYCSSLPLIQLSEIWLQPPSSRSSVTSVEGLGCSPCIYHPPQPGLPTASDSSPFCYTNGGILCAIFFVYAPSPRLSATMRHGDLRGK